MTIGLVGLGNMGLPVGRRLLERGMALKVHTRTPRRAAPLVERGARVAESPAALARRVDMVLVCVTDAAASEAVLLGGDGLAAAARRDQILIDLGTVSPELSRRCAEAAGRANAGFLDAPVSGGPDGAAAGTLTVMVGGDAAVLERARPILDALGTSIAHMGGPGAGSAAKLANQILVGVHTLAACEAMLFGARAGLDPRLLADTLRTAWGASAMLDRNAPRIVERRFGPSTAPLRNLAKDLRIATQVGEALGLSLPTAAQAAVVNRAASDAGLGADDLAAVYRMLEERASEG